MKLNKNMLFGFILAVSAGLLSACGGGGGGSSSDTVSQSTAVTVTSGGSGTVITTTATSAKTANNAVAVTIPASTVITPTGGTLAAGTLNINVATPANGTTSGVPPYSSSGTTFTLTDSSGAVDISIAGVTGFSLNSGATVVIPAPGVAPGNPAAVPVKAIKADGSTTNYTGTYDATAKTVAVTNVTNFCWFVANPTFRSSTGSTGSTGNAL